MRLTTIDCKLEQLETAELLMDAAFVGIVYVEKWYINRKQTRISRFLVKRIHLEIDSLLLLDPISIDVNQEHPENAESSIDVALVGIAIVTCHKDCVFVFFLKSPISIKPCF